MREADAVLAQTNDLLKHRKEALYAKHVEGRESLHELDYIFTENRDRPSTTIEAIPASSGPNWLDQHNKEIEAAEEEKADLSTNHGGRRDWNAKIDR